VERFRLFPEQASTFAPQTDALLLYLLGVTVAFVALIAGLIIFFMVRYRRRPGEDHDPNVHVPMSLEVAWSVIPFAISMVAFFWGASLYASLRRPTPSRSTSWGSSGCGSSSTRRVGGRSTSCTCRSVVP
jgi:cytochrome c oxidase subunit 2